MSRKLMACLDLVRVLYRLKVAKSSSMKASPWIEYVKRYR